MLSYQPNVLIQYFGRTPLYIFPFALYLCFLVGTATAPNLGGFLPLRFLSGFFSSVTIANIGGTISDLYDYHHTGYAMSLFLWAATCGSPLGYFLFALVAQDRPWRDVIWAILGVSGGFWLIMVAALLLCGETSHSIILLRRAKQLRKEGHEANVPEHLRQRGIHELFKIALNRPFRFLFTEPVVIFASLYNGDLYGLSFLFNDAFSVIFGPQDGGKGFTTLQIGLTFLGIVVGISLGPLTNVWQEQHYRKRTVQMNGRNIPEARVQLGLVAAVTLPISLFIFAFTSYRYLTWVGPVIASGLWGWSFYTLILMTYLYTEDCYGMYSASALAGIGLVRNSAGAGFPLFARQMFANEGFQYAGLILACLALVLIPIPFVLVKKGVWLRERSKWAREIIKQEEEGLR